MLAPISHSLAPWLELRKCKQSLKMNWTEPVYMKKNYWQGDVYARSCSILDHFIEVSHSLSENYELFIGCSIHSFPFLKTQRYGLFSKVWKRLNSWQKRATFVPSSMSGKCYDCIFNSAFRSNCLLFGVFWLMTASFVEVLWWVLEHILFVIIYFNEV